MTVARIRNAAARVLLSLLPWLLLLVALGFTWLTWEHERQASQTALRSQFDFALRETVSRVEQRVQGYEQMLRGVQSLFATTSLSNRAALHDYVQALQLDANFSGVQTIGLVEPEPDVWPDPVRRQALEKARDSGMAAISGKVQLKVDRDSSAPPGFIMYLPIYAQGQAHDSVAQRRAQLIGWVYASFHMSDFMASLYGSQLPGLSLAMYDGTDTTQASLFYRSGDGAGSGASPSQSVVSANEYMVVAGHNWTLSMRTQEAFAARYGRGTETVTAVAGSVLSVLLALLTWLMINGRERALDLAAVMTQELRASEQRFNRAVNGAQEGIWDLDLVSGALHHSPRMAQMLGYTESEMPAQREAWEAITNPDDRENFRAEMLKHFQDPGHAFDVLVRLRHRDGTWRWVQIRGTAARDAQGRALRFSGTQLDVTERKRLEAQVQQLAFYDPLTQLPNRRLFNDRLSQTLTRARREQSRAALMFIDLDKFKPINDEHGHEAGDAVLQSVARRVESCLRASDTAARVGGDEFLVLLPDLQTRDDALAVAEKIRLELERPFVTPGKLALQASASIGVAIYPDDGNTEQDLLRLGDGAMYQAKRSGGNSVALCAVGGRPEDSDELIAAGQSMVRLTWKAAFACGEPSIDSEHRELFRLSNLLLDKLASRSAEPGQFDAAFDALLAHVVGHFSHEEAILQAHGWEHLEQHAKLHQSLVAQALTLRHPVEQAEDLVAELVDFLVIEVVARHLLTEDRKFASLFSEATSGAK